MLFIYISATVQANIFKLSNGLSRVSHIEVKNQIQNLTNDMNISLPVIACSIFFFFGWLSQFTALHSNICTIKRRCGIEVT